MYLEAVGRVPWTEQPALLHAAASWAVSVRPARQDWHFQTAALLLSSFSRKDAISPALGFAKGPSPPSASLCE